MPEELIIAMAASIILATVKNPAKRARLDATMYKIWKTIGTAYPHFHQKLNEELNPKV